MSLYRALDRTFDTSRVCIKIASTFEGLQACKALNSHQVTTLATTLFTIEQAVLAADAGCQYIAPYLNALKSQIDDSKLSPVFPPVLRCSAAVRKVYQKPPQIS